MPKAKLHLLAALQIERTQSSGIDQMYNDGGGLYLFIRQYGAKEWIFRYSSPVTSQRRKQSIGTYPDTSLKEARRLASEKRDMLSRGCDPIIEAQKQRLVEIKHLAEREEKQRNTVRAVFSSWKTADLQNRKDKGKEIERAFEKDVFALIGKKPIGEVTRNDIKAILDRVLKRKARCMANRLLSNLKQFFGYADNEELISQDPTRRLIKDRVGGREKPRKRFLSNQEIKILNRILPLSSMKLEYQYLIWFLLATGCRVNEVLRMKWKHIDFEKRQLQIPSEHSKNTERHDVYLSNFAVVQLKALKKTKTTDWLVPGRSGDRSATRQVLTKQVTDRQKKPDAISRVRDDQALVLPDGRWLIHDLRRTTGTIMQELGIMPHIVKKCLNQKIEDKIIETYQRAELKRQQQDAFKKLGVFLEVMCQQKIKSGKHLSQSATDHFAK